MATQPPAPPTYIDTTNANTVRQWLESRARAGAIRRCANLQIRAIPSGALSQHFLAPICERESFEYIYPRAPDSLKIQLLEFHLAQSPVSCPKDCRYYENREWARFKRGCGRLAARVAVPFGWFAKADWHTQVAIIMAILLFAILTLFPGWIPLLTDLVRALRGK